MRAVASMSISAFNTAHQTQGNSDLLNPISLSGINYRNSSLELREKFAVSESSLPFVLKKIIGADALEEAVLLSTCNRVEIVGASAPETAALFQRNVEEIFSDISGVAPERFRENLYHFRGEQAINHLFRVASGLDSMVLGEPQILGQLKQAYKVANECGATRQLLNKLFHRAFCAAKVVRSRTKIGHHSVSVCYAARDLAEQIFGDLSQRRLMLFGAGEMGALAVKHFVSAGVKTIYVINRSRRRAQELADLFGGIPIELGNSQEFLSQADIIVGAMNVSLGDPAVIDTATMRSAIKKRPGEHRLVVDLAVPRSFDPTLGELEEVFLYNIDHLQEVVSRNLSSRGLEVERAELLVNDQVVKFCRWLDFQPYEKDIKELSAKASVLGAEEVARSIRRLRRLGYCEEQIQDLEQVLGDLVGSITSKLLHSPMSVIKRTSRTDPSLAGAFRSLFFEDD